MPLLRTGAGGERECNPLPDGRGSLVYHRKVPRVTPPADSDLLCESCGYVLNGLPENTNCPECGRPTAESHPSHRTLPAWERRDKPLLYRLLHTATAVLFRPSRFYRSLSVRQPPRASVNFARLNWLLTAILFAIAAIRHFQWSGLMRLSSSRFEGLAWVVLLSLITYVLLAGLTRLAASLSAWEGQYRGLRLPRPLVSRALHYHAVHYLPVAAVIVTTVVGYQFLLRRGLLSELSGVAYLYVLCGEVIVGAVYLFWTYWIGMRNVMYANG